MSSDFKELNESFNVDIVFYGVYGSSSFLICSRNSGIDMEKEEE